MGKKKSYNISNELYLHQYNDGIKLIRPDSNSRQLHLNNHYTVDDILNSTIPMWFTDANCTGVCTNEIAACEVGFISSKDSIGKTMLDVIEKNAAIRAMQNDNEVMRHDATKITEEIAFRKDGIFVNALCIKKPWYNDNNKIVGTFGCAILLDKYPLAETLAKIAKLGFLNTSHHLNTITGPQASTTNKLLMPGFEIDGVYFSKQEIKCIRLLVIGKTIKLMGAHLGLSPKTVEHYVENIKNKLNVKSKSELIGKLVKEIWSEIPM